MALGEKVPDCLRYMTELRNSAVNAVNIRRHADIMIEKAVKRALHALSIEMGGGGAESPQSAASCVDLVGLRNIKIAPVISDINTGINITRAEFASAYFDEEGCKLGFSHLESYKKRWNERDSRWSDEPRKDHTSEGADAFRQWAQAKSSGMVTLAGTGWGAPLNYTTLGIV